MNKKIRTFKNRIFALSLALVILFAQFTQNPFCAIADITISLPISLGGTVYDCTVRLASPVTSSGSTTVESGGTVCFPLEFLGGDGVWYPVRETELQGTPNDQVTVDCNVAKGEEQIGTGTWKTWEDAYGARYYIEYPLENKTTQDIDIDMSLVLKKGEVEDAPNQFVGKVSGVPITLPISLGGTVYDCTVRLASPVTSSGSTTVESGGTVCFPLEFLGGDGVWYPVRETELQGTPNDQVTVDCNVAKGEEQIGTGTWKTWEDAYGARYYIEYPLENKTTQDIDIDMSLVLKKGEVEDAPNQFVGVVEGTEKPEENIKVPIKINGQIYDCIVDLQGYLTSSGSDTIPSGGTVCFPLMFMGEDGGWYPVLKDELQGTPEELLTFDSAISFSGEVVENGKWKTWDNGHYFLEYTFENPTEQEKPLDFDVTLQKGDVNGSKQTFKGVVEGTEKPEENIKVPIKINGQIYDCIVDLQGYLTSSGSDTIPSGGTVCFPLMFMGEDGGWYPVLKDELQGTPEELLTFDSAISFSGEVVENGKWKTWDNGHYFLEYTFENPTEQEKPLDFDVTLQKGDVNGSKQTFKGVVEGTEKPEENIKVPIKINGQIYDCIVDLQGYLTSSGSDTIPSGGTVCFPLMFMGEDGEWYPVLKDELQGTPEELLTFDSAISFSGEVVENGKWKTWDNGHYFLEYTFENPTEQEKPLDFDVTLQKGDVNGSKQTFKGVVEGTEKPEENIKVPIKINGQIYDCIVDLQGYLTSSGSDTIPSGGTVCFPLMFMGEDGGWYPVLKDELQGTPEELLTFDSAISFSGEVVENGKWKTWDNGHYFLEYTFENPTEQEKPLDFDVTLQKGDVNGSKQTFKGVVEGTEKPEENIKVPIKINGQIYDCIVDLQGYLTSSGSDTIPSGGTVCFPLMFMGEDGGWYPVLKDELQGTPEELLTFDSAISFSGEVVENGKWKTWDNGHYFLEYTFENPTEQEKPLDFDVTLQKGDVNGSKQTFKGVVEGTEKPEENIKVPIKINGQIYDCIVDLQGYLTSSGSDTIPSGGTVCFPLMFMGEDGGWYPVLKDELQGTPEELLTFDSAISFSGEVVENGKWKTWDNGHYFLEYTFENPTEQEKPLDFDVTLQKGDVNGSKQTFKGVVEGTEKPEENIKVPIKINGQIYDCIVDLQGYLTSSGSDTIPSGGTVCFPLMFMGEDGEWYPVLKDELQGTPEELLTFDSAISFSGEVVENGKWKTWDNGHYFLEYTFENPTEQEKPLDFDVTLQKGDVNGSKQTFKGVVEGTEKPEENIKVPIKINGQIYDCIVDLQGYLTSSGSDTIPSGGTVCFPLMFMGEDGGWYPVLKDELQGTPEELLTFDSAISFSGEVVENGKWKTWDNGHYFLEYTFENPTEQEKPLDFDVTLQKGDVNGSKQTFKGVVEGTEKPEENIKVPIKINGQIYDCIVDLQGYLTSSGSDTIPSGGTVCFPLMFMGEDGEWYPVLKDELQGTPEELLTFDSAISFSGEVVENGKWKTWDNGHYFLEYTFENPTEQEKPLDFDVTLQKGDVNGSKQTFKGVVEGTEKPEENIKVPIKINGQIYDCIVDLQGYLTSSGSDTIPSGGTVCFPLMFMGEDGGWYPVLKDELQGTPEELLTFDSAISFSGEVVENGKWKTWDNGHYFLEYTFENPTEQEKPLDFDVTLQKGDVNGSKQTFKGVVEGTEKPEENIKVPIKINGQIYDCIVDLQGYLTSSGSDTIPSGGTVCFPLMFMGEDGEWYPVLKDELQGNPQDLFQFKDKLAYGNVSLGNGQWKSWENGHYFLEYTVKNPTKEEQPFGIDVTLQKGDVNGSKQTFKGVVEGTEKPEENIKVPIKINGQIYDCIVDLQGYLTSSGSDTIPSGGTVCFPLMFMGEDGEWYPVLKDELQGNPQDLFQFKDKLAYGNVSLGNGQWKSWENGHYFLEYTVKNPTKEEQPFGIDVTLQKGDVNGSKQTFKGVVEGTEKPEENIKVPIKINGQIYDCIVDLQGYLTSSGSDTIPSGGTVCFPLMFMGEDGEWYPVLKDELQGTPQDLFQFKDKLAYGNVSLGNGQWKSWENGHYFLEYTVKNPTKEEQPFGIDVTLQKGDVNGSKQSFCGKVRVATPIPQIPFVSSASLYIDKIAECNEYNTLSFTIAGVRYEEQWPVDFETPRTTDAILKDGSIIKADICFMVNGKWYPVRNNEVNEKLEEILDYEFIVLEGGECLGTPRLATRLDPYGDIWQFEVPVRYIGENSNFKFTICLTSKDGEKIGTVYEVSGSVQDSNGDFIVTNSAMPKTLIKKIAAAVIATIAVIAIFICFIKRRKKESDLTVNSGE